MPDDLTPIMRPYHGDHTPTRHDDPCDLLVTRPSGANFAERDTMSVIKQTEQDALDVLRKSASRETNEVDRFVGERIRLYRSMVGMSQQKLAENLGVTFQQLQKYERGENRIGAGRLLTVATVLDIPITFLLDEEGFSQRHGIEHSLVGTAPDTTRDAYTIGRAFSQITDPEIRRTITTLVQSLARQSETSDV
jgi:transcriptional regulator with XRE-family HTH domain